MISDVSPPSPRQRRKPKRIEPLEKPQRPSLHEQAKAETAAFKTPEEVAAVAPEEPTPKIAQPDTPKQRWYQLNWPPTRKQQIVCGVLAVVVAIGAGATWTLAHHRRTVTASGIPTRVKAAPKVVYSTLTGLPVSDASVNQKPVTAVMVENSLDARPQSGLGEAGVVFEAVAEGGVTRFMALYQDTTPTNVGPIRSARPYYVQWALGFNAAYAHVGGSDDALNDIKAWGVQDMNQFYNGGSYHRVSNRDAPHNVYTGIDTLNQLENSKGYHSSYTGFPRSKAAPAKQPTTTSIDLKLSGYTYDPHYGYNSATNSYDRSEAGEVQTDANTSKQLSPTVVVAMVVPLNRGALDSSGAYYSDYNVIGSGNVYIFQNGTLTQGTWTKTDNKAQLTFTDAGGKPLALNPGQTWVTAVSADSGVQYQ